MGRRAGLSLTEKQRHQLQQFKAQTKDKREYRAADGLLLRAEGKSANEVARRIGVTIKQVFMWARKFRLKGVRGLRVRKQTGRPARKAALAKPRIAHLIEQDPRVFGYLKGRWVLRDIARQLQKDGVEMHYTSVRRMLDELGIVLKTPRLRTPGSLKKNYRKRREIRRYKKVAAALSKKTSSSDSKTRSGSSSFPKSRDVGQRGGESSTSPRSVIPSG